MYNWKKDIAQWSVGDALYLSVVFTWDLPRAKEIALNSKKNVIAGGPAVALMPDYLADVAQCMPRAELFSPLRFHNPLATFTTRGCPNRCAFCAVPTTEGEFRELSKWEPKPLVCDNNLLAASRAHFERVIDSLKPSPFVDFNQGLEAALFTEHHAFRIGELQNVKVRFSFDNVSQESKVMDAIKLARQYGLSNIGVYVLVGHNDTPEDSIYRLELIRSLGIKPNPMRFQPLYIMRRNEYVAPTWSEYMLQKVSQYYSRLAYYSGIPFDEFEPKTIYTEQEKLF